MLLTTRPSIVSAFARRSDGRRREHDAIPVTSRAGARTGPRSALEQHQCQLDRRVVHVRHEIAGHAR